MKDAVTEYILAFNEYLSKRSSLDEGMEDKYLRQLDKLRLSLSQEQGKKAEAAVKVLVRYHEDR